MSAPREKPPTEPVLAEAEQVAAQPPATAPSPAAAWSAAVEAADIEALRNVAQAAIVVVERGLVAKNDAQLDAHQALIGALGRLA